MKIWSMIFQNTSASASVAGDSGAEVSAGASEAASGAVLTPLKRGLGRRFSLGPGRRDAGRRPGLPRLLLTRNQD